jgi:hypothetical protein
VIRNKMVKGQKGLYLEAWKFAVYLAVPIVASVYYSDPDAQRYWADYWYERIMFLGRCLYCLLMFHSHIIIFSFIPSKAIYQVS